MTAGLNSCEIRVAIELIQPIAKNGVTILVIEHVMKAITALAGRIVVLHQGPSSLKAPQAMCSAPRASSRPTSVSATPAEWPRELRAQAE